MEQLKTIKELINQGDVTEAIRQLDEYLITDSTDRDEAFYLLGNAYRKQGNWQLALNNYQYAIDLNPDSPAREAYRMAMPKSISDRDARIWLTENWHRLP